MYVKCKKYIFWKNRVDYSAVNDAFILELNKKNNMYKESEIEQKMQLVSNHFYQSCSEKNTHAPKFHKDDRYWFELTYIVCVGKWISNSRSEGKNLVLEWWKNTIYHNRMSG